MLRHAPTPLALADLTALTRTIAAEVGAGLHAVHHDPRRRWYRRLRGDDHVDVWLIGWAAEQSTELHDHAGSLGALTVVSGSLAEQRWTGTGLRTRRLTAGRSVGFPLGHVHDVVPATAPAISVHAYSPPLSAMSYYDVVPWVPMNAREPIDVPAPTDARTRPLRATPPTAPTARPRAGLALRRTRTVLVEPDTTGAVA